MELKTYSWMKRMTIKDWLWTAATVIGGVSAVIIAWQTMASETAKLREDVDRNRITHEIDIIEVKQTIKDFRREHREDMGYIRNKLDKILRK